MLLWVLICQLFYLIGLNELMRRLQGFFAVIRATFRQIKLEYKIVYTIADIDIDKQEILLRIKGKNVYFKQTFSQAILESKLVGGLSAQHACWLGIYYGRVLRGAQQGRGQLHGKVNRCQALLLVIQHSQYAIQSEHRNGLVTYKNIRHNEYFTEHPLTIVQNEVLLNRFHPNQACYLGILAGIALENQSQDKGNAGISTVLAQFKQRMHLRVVS